ncbi:hypothetical protein BDZ91DRAFT_655465 [Kalaharituber pfeilii]|nr:hypothetical protein BDZ91DRAFT_655465 [Kalaharituber pfeilii]
MISPSNITISATLSDPEQISHASPSGEHTGQENSPDIFPVAAQVSSRQYRHQLGILLVSVVVVLWVSANFLTWSLFSDATYSKPYLVNYINSAVFSVYLLPWMWRGEWKDLITRYRQGERPWKGLATSSGYSRIGSAGIEDLADGREKGKLSPFAVMRISAVFSIIWFLSNLFASICYVYTSAASGTILGSTSSVWTLLLCVLFRVERFTWPKALAVFISLMGVMLISKMDGSNRSPRDSTGNISLLSVRSAAEILLGDLLALIGAVFYGINTTLFKLKVGDESRIDMHLLFGFSGVINILLFWPGIVLAHKLGWEPLELPPSPKVYWILAANYTMSLVSDFSWAYAMLLTTPLLVTMGLSMTIPLALFAQMLIMWEIPGILYWVGAALVFGAFILVNKETEQEEVDEVVGAS